MLKKFLAPKFACLAACLTACLAACLASCGNDSPDPVTDLPPVVDSAAYEEGFVVGPDGVELYYRRKGSAAQTVIVPSRLFNWDELHVLANHFTYISYDMRNRGRSSSVEDGNLLTLEKDVEDLEAVRRHFSVESFSTIGYSYLGKVVVMYALAHPGRVDRIVQVGPVPAVFATEYPEELTSAGLPSAFAAEDIERITALRDSGVKETDPKRYCEAFWAVFPVSLVGNPANAARIDADYCDMENEWPVNLDWHMKHAFEGSAMNHVLSDEEIAEVEAPVLTIHGTSDRNAPYGAGREWALKLPNARLITVEGAGHHVWADDPTINDDIVTFFRGEWPDRAEIVTRLEPE